MKISTQNLIDRIRQQAIKNKLTKSGLAKQAGLDNKTLKDFWDNSWNPTAETLRKIEEVL